MLRFIPASAGNGTVTGIPEWLKTDHAQEVIEAPWSMWSGTGWRRARPVVSVRTPAYLDGRVGALPGPREGEGLEALGVRGLWILPEVWSPLAPDRLTCVRMFPLTLQIVLPRPLGRHSKG